MADSCCDLVQSSQMVSVVSVSCSTQQASGTPLRAWGTHQLPHAHLHAPLAGAVCSAQLACRRMSQPAFFLLGLPAQVGGCTGRW